MHLSASPSLILSSEPEDQPFQCRRRVSAQLNFAAAAGASAAGTFRVKIGQFHVRPQGRRASAGPAIAAARIESNSWQIKPQPWQPEREVADVG